MKQEEKAKAYDEALDRAKEFHKSKEGIYVLVAETIFPELRESEDERVRKIITDSVFYQYGAGDEYKDVLDYLDKLEQQEKKEVKFVFPKFLYARTTNNKTIDVSYAPQSLDAVEYIRSDSLQQEWSEEDEKMLARIIERGQSQIPMFQMGLLPSQIAWLESLPERFKPQPQQEWSEADEVYLKYALWCVERAEKSCKPEDDKGACWSARRWLKSLRPSWKPSEEQMDSLRDTIIHMKGYSYSMYLPELYEQLKKL